MAFPKAAQPPSVGYGRSKFGFFVFSHALVRFEMLAEAGPSYSSTMAGVLSTIEPVRTRLRHSQVPATVNLFDNLVGCEQK